MCSIYSKHCNRRVGRAGEQIADKLGDTFYTFHINIVFVSDGEFLPVDRAVARVKYFQQYPVTGGIEEFYLYMRGNGLGIIVATTLEQGSVSSSAAAIKRIFFSEIIMVSILINFENGHCNIWRGRRDITKRLEGLRLNTLHINIVFFTPFQPAIVSSIRELVYAYCAHTVVIPAGIVFLSHCCITRIQYLERNRVAAAIHSFYFYVSSYRIGVIIPAALDQGKR